MVVKHSDTEPVDFNILLPQTKVEVVDLGYRLSAMRKAVENLQNNVPLGQCGKKVKDKATEMGIPHATGIRQFLAHQIAGIPADKRDGTPGYKLLNTSNIDIGRDFDEVNRAIDEVFSNKSLVPHTFVQPPDKNTQLLSHIHCFMLEPDVGRAPGLESCPPALDENYFSACVIFSIKNDMVVDDELDGDESGFEIKTPLTKFLLGVPVEQCERWRDEYQAKQAARRAATAPTDDDMDGGGLSRMSSVRR
jgi:hypothetical protein